jgi:DNA-binding transcriptional LysR family regulator
MDLRRIDLNLLVALDALLTEASVSRAAVRLRVSQPAASHALKRLRDRFDDMLLVRDGGQMRLTPRGAGLLAPVKDALAACHSVLSSGEHFDPRTAARTFRMAMSDAMTVENLPLIMRRLRGLRSSIDLEVDAAGPQHSCRLLLADEIDLAVGVFPHIPKGLTTRDLYRDQLVCVVDRKNPWLRNGRLDYKAYLQAPHVTVNPTSDSGIQLDEILVAMGIRRRIAVSVPHYLALPSGIRGTDLIGLSRRRLLSVFRNTSSLLILPVPVPVAVPELVFMQVWHRRYDLDPGHRWFRDLVWEAIHSSDQPASAASRLRNAAT